MEELLDMEKDDAGETVAVANFTNAVNQTGWSYLEIKTSPRFPDEIQVSSIEWKFREISFYEVIHSNIEQA